MHESMLTTKIHHEEDMREVEIIKFIKQNPGSTTNQVVKYMGRNGSSKKQYSQEN